MAIGHARGHFTASQAFHSSFASLSASNPPRDSVDFSQPGLAGVLTMLNSIGVSNTHTNPYPALEEPQSGDKINSRQTTDNLTNHARSAVIPQSLCDRAPLNAIMAMEAAASQGSKANTAVTGMLDNFTLTDQSEASTSACDGRAIPASTANPHTEVAPSPG